MRDPTPRTGGFPLTLAAALLLAGTAFAGADSTSDPATELADQAREAAEPTLARAMNEVVATLEDTPAPSAHCHAEENPHRYSGAASYASQDRLPLEGTPLFPSSPFAKTSAQVYQEPGFSLAGAVLVHDGSVDCHGEGADVTGDGEADLPVVARLALSDGDLESGVGGGFFPASHHGSAFEVTDASGARVAFTVASDADGDGTLEAGECRETFIRRGETGCGPGGDGGWWVVLHARVEVDGEVSSAPTTGLIVSGPLSEGSQRAGLPMLASVQIFYDGEMNEFSWSSPGGWDCESQGNVPGEPRFALWCESPESMSWNCQNHHVFVHAVHDGASASTSEVRGTMECGPFRFAICDAVVDAASPHRDCMGGYLGSAPAPFICKMEVQGISALRHAVVECFNDP